MRVAVCDDITDVLKQVSFLVKEISVVDTVMSYSNFDALVTDIDIGTQYDVVLMDIEWGEQDSGIYYATQLYRLSPNTKVIFMTGYQKEYSQQIFLSDVNLCGFLVKPIKREFLSKMLEKAKSELLKTDTKKLTVSFNGVVTSFHPEDIYYLESKAHTASIYTIDGIHLCYERLEELKKRLPDNFVYSHKSYLINMDHIKRIEGNKLILLNETAVPVSKSKYAQIKKLYFSYIGNRL